jgi:endonuclease/exonuclease/phosphatase (EEP) superfamily protein YafD
MKHVLRPLSRRGEILTWLCALGALTAFLPWMPETVLPVYLAWVGGLASHWQWVFLALGLSGAALALLGRRLRPLVPAVVIVLAWLNHSPSAPRAPGTGSPGVAIAVASANLNFERRDHDMLVGWLTSGAGPDVITLQEFTSSARAAVLRPEVLAVYPHQVLEPSADQFGLAVLSRHRIESVERVDPADVLGTLKLRTVLEVQGRKVAFTAVHPMPPINAAYARERDASLRTEGLRLASGGMPGILAGDMNDTPWSTGIRAAAPLQRATGLSPTWPNAWGWFSMLPLDHILVTPGFEVVDDSLGPDLGSDHRPVLARLVLR